MENIVDPENPTTDCYDDVQWSEVDGRFWSNIACFEEKRRPQGKIISEGKIQFRVMHTGGHFKGLMADLR